MCYIYFELSTYILRLGFRVGWQLFAGSGYNYHSYQTRRRREPQQELVWPWTSTSRVCVGMGMAVAHLKIMADRGNTNTTDGWWWWWCIYFIYKLIIVWLILAAHRWVREDHHERSVFNIHVPLLSHIQSRRIMKDHHQCTARPYPTRRKIRAR